MTKSHHGTSNGDGPSPGNKIGPGHPPWDKRWQKGGPSPNPAGRPPKKHLKQLSSILDPLAAEGIEFDGKPTGALDRQGVPITNGGIFLSALQRRALTDQRAAALYERVRREA